MTQSGAARREFAARAKSNSAFDAALGEHFQAIAKACATNDPGRLVRAPAGASEVDPTAGGFLVEPVYSSTLVQLAYEESQLAQRCDRRTTTRPGDVKVPGIDETSRADGARYGGAASYWASESSNVSASVLRWKRLEFSAHKLITVAVASNELMADAPMLGAHLRRCLVAEFGFALDRAVLLGSGVGQPLGIVGASGTVVVPKVIGQAAGTIVGDNIAKMWSALPTDSRRRAVWVVGETIEEQLDGIMPVTPSAAAIYMPAGTGGNPNALLKGRPVLVAEQSPLAGTPGDIALADLSHYVIVQSEISTALSTHVRFDNDESKFRFVLRVDGMPDLSAPITAFAGGGKRSPFVTLAAR